VIVIVSVIMVGVIMIVLIVGVAVRRGRRDHINLQIPMATFHFWSNFNSIF
jgi:hypothetical protein